MDMKKVKARKDFPLPLGALENQTLSSLQLHGSCYGDAKLRTSISGNSSFKGIFTMMVSNDKHYINTTVKHTTAVDLDTWHKRLGHVSMGIIPYSHENLVINDSVSRSPIVSLRF